jgi:SRSO17 transposase
MAAVEPRARLVAFAEDVFDAFDRRSQRVIGTSLHAVGERGTLPLGWSLYLPKDWCDDPERRRRAKMRDDVAFQTKPQLALALIRNAVQWDVPSGPILGDQAYGDDGAFRVGLDDERLSYVLAVSETASVYGPDTEFVVPKRAGALGRTPHVGKADRPACSLGTLARTLPEGAFETRAVARAPDGTEREGRFACVRVYAAHEILRRRRLPRAEWLIIAWPDGADAPTDYWLSNLPAGTPHAELARLARLRWTIDLDYRQLKGELGLDHYEGRSFAGWHHHTALVSTASGRVRPAAALLGRGAPPVRKACAQRGLARLPHPPTRTAPARLTLRHSRRQSITPGTAPRGRASLPETG